jgi:hypothetical protein
LVIRGFIKHAKKQVLVGKMIDFMLNIKKYVILSKLQVRHAFGKYIYKM